MGDQGRHAHLQRCQLSRSGRKLLENSVREGVGLEARGEGAEFREVSGGLKAREEGAEFREVSGRGGKSRVQGGELGGGKGKRGRVQ